MDYLQETNPAVRRVAALALGLAAVVLGLLAVGGLVVCAVADLPAKDGVSPEVVLLPLAAAFGVFGCVSGIMARRLLSGRRSANGVTLMPTWFISGFGLLFFAGLVWAAIRADAPFMLIECGIVALAMVLVGRLARAKRRRQAAGDADSAVKTFFAVVSCGGLIAGGVRADDKPLCDADRLKLLKPVMTLAELDRVRHGKDSGQACGGITDKAGRDRSYFRNVYNLVLPGKPLQTMAFEYVQDKPDGSYTMFRVEGPGFRYELRDGKYVAVEGPPKR